MSDDAARKRIGETPADQTAEPFMVKAGRKKEVVVSNDAARTKTGRHRSKTTFKLDPNSSKRGKKVKSLVRWAHSITNQFLKSTRIVA